MSQSRQAAWRFGQAAETLAAWMLRAKGYGIIARDHRTPVGEIDIIARRGGVLAFVEVKARRDLTTAAEALGPAQRRRIERAAEAFLSSHPQYADCDIRFDVILIAPPGLPRHLPGAWLVGD
ncbi:MAG: YraN family protein [Alphaproteobacteria bacterium]